MSRADIDALTSFAHRLPPVKVRGRDLPRLWFLTDRKRVADPLRALHGLPAGSGVILRDYDAADRRGLAASLAAAAKKLGLVFLVADDADLAAAVEADGLHLPERALGRLREGRAPYPHWLMTVSAHTPAALAAAAAGGADAAFVAPVFATESHPGAPHLGVTALTAMASKARVPVIALGGIDAATVLDLEGAPVAGIAAIGALG